MPKMFPMNHLNSFPLYKKLSTLYKSHNVSPKVLYPLKSRGLVKVSGPDAAPFLQVLITNDMNHFEEGGKSMYALFLNNKGRVLYDVLVHKWGCKTDNVFMLECDKCVQHLLQQHLTSYQLNQNIKVEDMSKLYKLWAFIAPPNFGIDSCDPFMENIHVYKDPRLADLGHRLITAPELGDLNIRQAVGLETIIEIGEQEYQTQRYKLGVGEGAADMFPGTCGPLEVNCDYLHGLSFQKVNYIGREFINVCRTDQTCVRQRLMPIQFLSSKNKKDLEEDAIIWANTERGRRSVGKLQNYVGKFGLGLVKIKDALQAKTLHIGANPIVITQPHWWPKEILKE